MIKSTSCVGGSGFRHGRRKHREGNRDFHSLRRKFSVVQFRHIDTVHIQGTAPGGRLFCDTAVGEVLQINVTI